MFTNSQSSLSEIVDTLAARGYWAALAAGHLTEGRYSRAVELCKEHLSDGPEIISGRLIYARALYHAGQTQSAAEQFYRVLSRDSNNLVALKYLGDIFHALGDQPAAMAHYQRVLDEDPDSRALCCRLTPKQTETTHTVTLRRAGESPSGVLPKRTSREIPFYTETMGDLYMTQGYPRLAADVYRVLNSTGQNPRLTDKLADAEEKIKEKESAHVKKAD